MDMDKIDATPMGLSPGDVLVLRPAEPLTREAAEKLAAHVSGLLPDIKVLVTDPGLTVTPMRFVAGDVCVVRLPEPVPAEQVEWIKQSVAASLPEGTAVMLTNFDVGKSSAHDRLAVNRMAKAAIAQYANDLAGMSRDKIEAEIRDAERKIEEEEPWLEALTARLAELDAAAKHPVTYHVTEDGEPWAVYREGAHPVECLTRQDVIDAMNGYGSGDGDDWAADNPELPAVTVFHLSSIEPESTRSKKRRRDDDDDDMLSDERLWFCDADDPGAYPVTGLKFG